MRMFPPGCQRGSRARPYPCRAPSSWSIRWSCRIKGVFIQAPDLADMLKALARNLDGTSPRYKCTEVVDAQVSGPDGREGGRSDQEITTSARSRDRGSGHDGMARWRALPGLR